MNPNHSALDLTTEKAIASTLTRLVKALSLFSDLLQQEQHTLTQYKPDSIETLTQLTQKKADTAFEIETLYHTLAKELSSASLTQSSDVIDFIELSKNSHLSDSLKQTFNQAHQLIIDNHQANLRNGMLIQSLSTLNQHALLALKGQNESFSEYNAHGKKQPSSTPNTPLGKA